ncbi:MAG: hypothetical protein LWX83_15765 [Anaerolineae bacterium]|nr:hypothetical protein [Anaerolineae bacterium]
MKFYNSRLVVGLVLILAGVLSLLQATGLVTIGNQLHPAIVSSVFGLAGLLFLGILINHRQDWWVLFPGMALSGLSVIIMLDAFAPQIAWASGAVFMAMLALSFWLVYLINRNAWWAIIPGGVLTTLAAIILSDQLSVLNGGTIFFLGLAATFGLVYFVTRQKWAWIPGVVMLGMSAVTSSLIGHYSAYLWPVILIGIGLVIAYRSFRAHS